MTTVHQTRTHPVGRIATALLSVALCMPAALATSVAAQSDNGVQTAKNARKTERLTFTGAFRFRPTALRARINSAAPPANVVGTTKRARTPGQAAAQRTTHAQPLASKSKTEYRPGARLSRATRSGLGAPPVGTAKPETAPSPPVTAAIANPARATPPLPTRFKRAKIKKRARKVRSVARTTRVEKRKPRPRAAKPVEPPSSTIYDEAPPWANRALFKSN